MKTLEYRQWALHQLTPVQWLVYETVRDLGEGLTTISAIAQWCALHRETTTLALKVLDNKRFIKMTHLSSQGVLIEWVRSSADEERPKLDTMRWRRLAEYGNSFKSPDGKVYTVAPGKLSEFAKQHNLSYRCLQHLIDGDIKHHRGWIVATSHGHARTA